MKKMTILSTLLAVLFLLNACVLPIPAAPTATAPTKEEPLASRMITDASLMAYKRNQHE